MKHLGLALGISFSVAIAIFGITYPIFGNAHIAEGLAAIPIVGSHHIAELLERREGKLSLLRDKQTSIYRFDQFGLSWQWMIVFGTLVLSAVVQASGALAALVSNVLFGDRPAPEQELFLLASFSIGAQVFGGYTSLSNH
jgi:hypothetical protein